MVMKKGQLKIQQMAFMLMAVTLFFVLAGMFLLTIKFSGLKESATILEERNAILLSTKLANSPEFSCGGAFGTKRINCIDLDKILALKTEITSNSKKYKSFWGVSDIEIRTIYPDCDLADSTKNCIIRMFSDSNDAFMGSGQAKNFVSLCRKNMLNGRTYDQCDLALITIAEK